MSNNIRLIIPDKIHLDYKNKKVIIPSYKSDEITLISEVSVPYKEFIDQNLNLTNIIIKQSRYDKKYTINCIVELTKDVLKEI